MKLSFRISQIFRLAHAVVALLMVWTTSSTGGTDTGRPLTPALEIRTMSDQELGSAPVVRLRGVVLRAWAASPSFILKDQTDAIYVSMSLDIPDASLPPSLHAGSVVEVDGAVGPGMFAPEILVRNRDDIRIVGTAPLPAPRPLTPEAARAGRMDAHLVSVEGVVRRAAPLPPSTPSGYGSSGLELVFENTRLIVLVESVPADWRSLVDARVRITGISSGIWNKQRQITAPCLMKIRPSDIEVLSPAPADPFALKTLSVADIMRYRPQDPPGHRIRITGTVLLALPDARVFVFDGERTVCVECTDPVSATAGDIVDAAGFPSMRERAPLLEDSVLKVRSQHGEMPPIIRRSASTLISDCNDYELVEIEATLIEAQRSNTGTSLLLQSGECLFKAICDTPDPSREELSTLEPGSKLSLAGLVLFGFPSPTVQAFRPNGFSLLLRSPDDVRVLYRPSWWTVGRLTTLLSATVALVLVFALWNHLLRSRAAIQQEIISTQARREATSEERTRLARELHDTLEQEFVGMTRQTEALEHAGELPPQALERLLELRQMLQFSRDNARRTVWDLRDPTLLDKGLDAAIRTSVQRILADKPVALEVRTLGTLPRDIPSPIQIHVLRLAQEAATNAMKHAKAGQIDIWLCHDSEALTLTISDDGKSTVIIESPEAGHFGILGMRERCEKLGGRFEINTQPCGGTIVSARIPISSDD